MEAQLEKLREEYRNIKPEEIKVIDPCMGSGHILVYAFEVLMKIYTSAGWDQRDSAQSILRNNLYGLDIDDRAAQLAYFAVMMKARQYDRRLLTRGIQPNLFAIRESNRIDEAVVRYFHKGDPELKAAIESVIDDMRDAKEYGSIISVRSVDFERLYARFDEIIDEVDLADRRFALDDLLPVVRSAELLSTRYDVAVTNPPYMGGSGMNTKLSEYVKGRYPDSKSDLFAVFIERCGEIAKSGGYQAMITQHSWMFLSSFEKLRERLLSFDIVNMAHLGARAFEEIGGEVVQTTAFVIRRNYIAGYKGEYCRLISPTTQQGKEDMFLAGENRFAAEQANFSKIPGCPVAYWVGDTVIRAFENNLLGQVAYPKTGFTTGNNDDYLRLWHEVSIDKVGSKWFALNKGGAYRKWYGNNEYLVDWENNGQHIKEQKGSTIRNPEYYFKEGVTWSKITSYKFSGRYSPADHIFDAVGLMCFEGNNVDLDYILALFCSEISSYFLAILNPTLSMTTGAVSNLPVIYSRKTSNEMKPIVKENVEIAKEDWNSYETSWDFKRNPLI